MGTFRSFRGHSRYLNVLSKHSPRGRLGVSIDNLAERLSAIEARLAPPAEVGLAPPAEAGRKRDYSDSALASVAERVYRARRRRARHFPKMFAEPAWDMLLDLFIARVRGKLVSTTSLCLASAVPESTALRWIRVLEEHGLVERHKSSDRRVTPVSLTDRGCRVMRQYLTEGIEARELPTNGGFA